VTDQKWSKADDGDLKRMMREGRTLKEATVVLQRTTEDVQRRLRALGSRMPGARRYYGETDPDVL
jgi:hypothetical protein